MYINLLGTEAYQIYVFYIHVHTDARQSQSTDRLYEMDQYQATSYGQNDEDTNISGQGIDFMHKAYTKLNSVQNKCL